jgi:3-methyladenine DNA glycosylase AlkC
VTEAISMDNAIELSVSQQFELERFNRAIDATADPDALRSIAKQLLQAWQTQKAATNWVIRQQMAPPQSP